MAIISKIRKQSTVLLIAIGGAMVLFILGDFLTSSSVFFTGQNTELGEIDGEKISYADFERKVQNYMYLQFGGRAPDEFAKSQVRDRIWEEYIRDIVYNDEYTSLGLSVSDEELLDIIKNDADNPTLRNYFTNPQTGRVFQQFANPDGSINTEIVMQYFRQVLSMDPNTDQQAAEALRSYQLLKENLYTTTLDNKYFTLIQKGLYVPQAEYEQAMADRNSQYSVSYVAQYYNTIPDSAYSASEAELKSYYNEHKHEAQYQQNEDVRSLDYVLFEIVPTQADRAALQAELADLIPAFSNAIDDTVFVNENGDTPFNVRWVSAGEFPDELDSVIMNAPVDSIIGPFERDGVFEIAKVNAFNEVPDSVRARHILIPIADNDTATAEAKADSLRSVIRKEDNFAQLAPLFSADSASAIRGGDLDWFTYGTMVPAFNDAAFEGEAGDMPIVTTQFGVHLIDIQEQTSPKMKARLAIVNNLIEPSDATRDSIYSVANAFAVNNKTADKFLEGAEAYGLLQAPSIRKNDITFMGIDNSREVVRWGYTAEVDNVSSVFAIEDQFIVARLKEVLEEGTLPLSAVRAQVEQAVILEKKAADIKAKMQGSDLNALASQLGTSVQTIPDLTFASFSIQGIGAEPKLQGVIASLQEGQVSLPIEGRRAVYVVQVTAVQKQPETITVGREQIASSYQSRVATESYKVLKDQASIEDNRASFY